MEADGVRDTARRQEHLAAMEASQAPPVPCCAVGAAGRCRFSARGGCDARRLPCPALLSAALPQTHLAALSGYGEEHMLVKTARALFEEAQAAALADKQ